MTKQKSENIWIAFLLKDKYSSDNEKDKLKSLIIKKFNRKKSQIRYTSSYENPGLCFYFFVKQNNENDLKNIFQSFGMFLSAYNSHTKIKEYELNQMLKTIKKKDKKIIAKFGDFVIIKKGKYNKLYGIVLRENRCGKVQVGLNFCFGKVIQTYQYQDLISVGNIFNYIKVLK